MVHGLVQVTHVVGPILGGSVNSLVGMTKACSDLAWLGVVTLVIYLVLSLFVYCTVHEENVLALRSENDLNISEKSHEDVDDTSQSDFVNVKAPKQDANRSLFDLNLGQRDPEETGLLAVKPSVRSLNVSGQIRGVPRNQLVVGKSGSGGKSQRSGGSAHNDSLVDDLKKQH